MLPVQEISAQSRKLTGWKIVTAETVIITLDNQEPTGTITSGDGGDDTNSTCIELIGCIEGRGRRKTIGQRGRHAVCIVPEVDLGRGQACSDGLEVRESLSHEAILSF